MATTERMFNGTTITFNSAAVGKLAGLSLKIGGQWVDVTEPEDVNKIYELSSQPDFALQLKFRGNHTLTDRASGTLTATFSDGSTHTLPGRWQVGVFEFSGDWDAPWQSTAEARPTIAAAA